MTTKAQHTSKTAVATRLSGGLYDVRYVGSRDIDPCVPYSYLEGLARRGYEVRVNASPYGPASTIAPQD